MSTSEREELVVELKRDIVGIESEGETTAHWREGGGKKSDQVSGFTDNVAGGLTVLDKFNV